MQDMFFTPINTSPTQAIMDFRAIPQTPNPTRQFGGSSRLQELQLLRLVSFLQALETMRELQTFITQNYPSKMVSVLPSISTAQSAAWLKQPLPVVEDIITPEGFLERDVINEVAAALILASRNLNSTTASVVADGLTALLQKSDHFGGEVSEPAPKLPSNLDADRSDMFANYLFEIPYSSENPKASEQPSVHEVQQTFPDSTSHEDTLQRLTHDDIDMTLLHLQLNSEGVQLAASSLKDDVLEDKLLHGQDAHTTIDEFPKLRSWPSRSSLSSGYSSDSPLSQDLMLSEMAEWTSTDDDDSTQSSEWLLIPLAQWTKRQCRAFLDWVWELYELSSSPKEDELDLNGAELLALSLEELQSKSEHGSLLYAIINWLREPGFVIFYEDEFKDPDLAVQDMLSMCQDPSTLEVSGRPEYVSTDANIYHKNSLDVAIGAKEKDSLADCTCPQKTEEAMSPPASSVTLTPPPNGMTSPSLPVSPSFIIGSRLWPPDGYRNGFPALNLPRPPTVPNGLPPVPPLIPSPTSPGMMKFTHFKQTLSPSKSPDTHNGDVLLPSLQETTRIEAFQKSPDKEFVSRKRAHSPEKKHFSFESSFIAAANKKPFVPNGKSLYEARLHQAMPPTKPVYSYAAHSMPMVPNTPGGPGKDVPRMSRRDQVVPIRLNDYEVPPIRATHQKISRVIKSQDNLTTGIKYSKSFKNGHYSIKNCHLDNRVIKEPNKVPGNARSPSNKPSNNLDSALSPRSSDEDSVLSPISPISPFPRDCTASERTRRTSSSSTDSGTEEPRAVERADCSSPNKLSTAPRKTGRRKQTRSLHLWEFLKEMLENEDTCPRYITWISPEEGVFRLVNSSAVAKLWGQRKNRRNMNYEKMSRALRYYYERHILERVPGQRLIYKFAPETMKDCNFSFMKKSS